MMNHGSQNSRRFEAFLEKLMMWLFDGGKSPFRRDDFPKRPGLSQTGGVSLETKSGKKGMEKRY